MITSPKYPTEHDPDWPLHIGTDKDQGIIHYEPSDVWRYNLDGATVLYFIRWWVLHHEKLGLNRHDGRYWIRISAADLAKRLRFLSDQQVQELLRRLVDEGAIVVGSYNDDRDRTCWYTIATPDEQR